MKYKGYLVEEKGDTFSGTIQEVNMPPIADGNVIIKVNYSSLNYKDALASSGAKGVVSSYPFIPGIDVAGEILESSSTNFSEGDLVIATGYKLGMSVFGGFGELVQIPSDWVVPLPDKMSLLESMSYGTAGLTAGACVKKILDSNKIIDMPVVVSGATGGVGSVAVNLLNKLGYEVHAITGKPTEEKLLNMGASKIIDRTEFLSTPAKSLDRAIFSAGVDTVGGETLSKMLSMIDAHGSVSCCGNVGGAKFTSSVFPFILRGINLIGIDSAESEIEFKKSIWNLFANEWLLDLSAFTKVISLRDVNDEISKILDGKQIGRVVIKHGD
ncbi:MAG: YhdH/YhfP family quinone oxidoreductase [Proteobacteria bacterium]|jgi:alcohol dehydrogenase|uniref:YhdH/YhfP family quinone oxidoreductase n=1 Tax=SAR86 cluster bacterium TaxID=2030880 RepID=A0A937ID89_9GAMM|nr:YhdH/YhfP family quinone oxidoreductase [SAR86 cluster bacterium]MDA0775312.1 YhdH/YhfP family quinone oxidoreductase [Pseudomonadota bacterium]MDA0976662.1 YhdH/YhfP family quinone oxidoreductase [Pseudomonadota bacterium]MDA1036829.1 YhdH/YhfP family quinone oxidoreductase [Pseudomonadota bacterium]